MQSAQRGRPALRLLSTAVGYNTSGFGSVVGGSGCDAVDVGLLSSAEAIVLAGAGLLSTHLDYVEFPRIECSVVATVAFAAADVKGDLYSVAWVNNIQQLAVSTLEGKSDLLGVLLVCDKDKVALVIGVTTGF